MFDIKGGLSLLLFFLFFLHSGEEISHACDPNRIVSFKLQQVIVPTDDVVRPARNGAFKDAVIRRVLYYVQSHLGLDDAGHFFERFSRFGNILRRPVEFLGEHSRGFI